MPQYYKPKDCQHPSKVFGSTSISLISIGGDLADEHTNSWTLTTQSK
jgi:hypothetical protein